MERDPISRKKTIGTAQEAELDPYEIDFLPEFIEGRGPRQPFVNKYGVVIGDHDYESSDSPLEQWSENTDPSVMAGDEWVHPFKDVGFQSAENRDYFEKGIPPQSGVFMHPDKDVAYGVNNSGEPREKRGSETIGNTEESGKNAGKGEPGESR